MPYGDANAIMLEMANEILTVVKKTPVLAGICGTDPFRDMSRLLREVKDLGFTGVQNFPTVGLIDGVFRQNLEETGMEYGKESPGARDGPFDNTLRFQRRRGGAHDRSWSGHHCRAHGSHDERNDRCAYRADLD